MSAPQAGLADEIAALASTGWPQYADTIRRWEEWCAKHGLSPLEADEQDLLRYLCMNYGDWSHGYARVVVSRVNRHHREAGLPQPAGLRTKQFLKAIARNNAPMPKVAPILDDALEKMLVALGAEPDTTEAERGRADVARLRGVLAMSVLLGWPINEWLEAHTKRYDKPSLRWLRREQVTRLKDGSLRVDYEGHRYLLDVERNDALVSLVVAWLDLSIGETHPFRLRESDRAPLKSVLSKSTLDYARVLGGDWAGVGRVDLEWLLGSVDRDLETYLRNVAYLLTAFWLARRHQDTMEMHLEGVRICSDGVRIQQPRSKTDRNGKGVTLFLAHVSPDRECVTGTPCHPMCPARAVHDYVLFQQYARGRTAGPLFLSREGKGSKAVGRGQMLNLLRKLWVAAGLPQDAFIGTRSLRAGGATAADRAGASLLDIMRMLGHKHPQVTTVYIRRHDPWQVRLALLASPERGA